MTTTPPPHRPRPRPRPVDPLQARVDAFFAAGDQTVAPRSRRLLPRPRALARGTVVQRASQAAVAGGVALFVVASLTTSVAGAPGAHRAPPAEPSTGSSPVPTAAASAAPAIAAATPAEGRPALAAVRAPADGRAVSSLAANGIPAVALNAYRVAAARVADRTPGCGIDWALLAGIGREESDHGRFHGAVLHTDGRSTPAIVGPALDGVHWTYVPAATDYVAVTHDTTYAHALGPLQFIPTTWATYGADADGDGRADVFDINDAALGAARYLCAAGGDLRSHAGLVAAVSAYNQSDQYVAQVLALADAYRRGVALNGTPVGDTTGTLPTVPTGYVPPANPGAPAAAPTGGRAAPGPAGSSGTGSSGTGSSGAGSSGAPASGSGAPASGGTTASAPTSAPPASSAPSSAAPSSAPATTTPPSGGGTSTCHLGIPGLGCLG